MIYKVDRTAKRLFEIHQQTQQSVIRNTPEEISQAIEFNKQPAKIIKKDRIRHNIFGIIAVYYLVVFVIGLILNARKQKPYTIDIQCDLENFSCSSVPVYLNFKGVFIYLASDSFFPRQNIKYQTQRKEPLYTNQQMHKKISVLGNALIPQYIAYPNGFLSEYFPDSNFTISNQSNTLTIRQADSMIVLPSELRNYNLSSQWVDVEKNYRYQSFIEENCALYSFIRLWGYIDYDLLGNYSFHFKFKEQTIPDFFTQDLKIMVVDEGQTNMQQIQIYPLIINSNLIFLVLTTIVAVINIFYPLVEEQTVKNVMQKLQISHPQNSSSFSKDQAEEQEIEKLNAEMEKLRTLIFNQFGNENFFEIQNRVKIE